MTFPSAHVAGAMVFVAMGLASLPGLLSAQVSESTLLRDEIRSALQSDPRSGTLSPEEFDRIVETLAGEVEASGQTEDFVLPNVYIEELVPYAAPETRLQLSVATIYGIVIVSLGLALLAIRHAHTLHTKKARV